MSKFVRFVPSAMCWALGVALIGLGGHEGLAEISIVVGLFLLIFSD